MAKKKKSRRQAKRGKQLTPIERILKMKADSFLKAEKEFWKFRYDIEQQHLINAEALGLGIQSTIPDELSSIVWALKDGVSFVRYQSPGQKGNVSFRSMNISLEQWGNEGLVIPTSEGEISLAQVSAIRGLGSITLHDCHFNDLHIPYVEIKHAYYDQDQIPPPIQSAIIDFQLAFLGAFLNEQEDTVQYTVKDVNTIEKLSDIASQFEKLLSEAEREEELQVFLKVNPMVLHPSASVIPKKKLGEDFVTDFVLVTSSDQGSTFTLVEIERASHPIMTKDYSLSSPTNHAIKQTRDWDVWLEKNKAYIQGKLPGFETPKYLIVIGRGTDLDDEAKAYLRSYNRDWKNIELLTFDDLLVRYKDFIDTLRNTINPQSS